MQQHQLCDAIPRVPVLCAQLQMVSGSSLHSGSRRSTQSEDSLPPEAAGAVAGPRQTDDQPQLSMGLPQEEDSRGSGPRDQSTPLRGLSSDSGDVAASPVQAAVAAVAGRLQSVQQGLASAEGRLAQLTGRKAAKRSAYQQ